MFFMSNPLLEMSGLPPFSAIKPEHVEPAVDQVLADNRALVKKLVSEIKNPDWNNFVQPLEEADELGGQLRCTTRSL
jgi:oligopeptidase A